MYQVEQYTTADGDCPFAVWFDSLNEKAALKVQTVLGRIELGSLGDVKPVGGGVSERRIDFGPGYRVYFGKDGDQLVVLLGGGTKSRQNRDIKQAQERWADYKKQKRQRKKDNGTN